MRWRRLGLGAVLACVGCGNASQRSGDAAVIPQIDAPVAHEAAAAPAKHDASVADTAVADAPGDALLAGATWTSIYQTILVNPSNPSNCMGSSCHDPGIQKGVDLSSKDTGFTTISRRLIPGSPDSSTLIVVLQSGAMPQGRPHMPTASIDLIRAWIQAGAANN